ncbi:MAG: class II aldolase/adducin family protein, partial [Propionivibrio sp.]|nr:class II aldolase/adducin family protein [Propionivibrio sp.]
MNAPEQVQQLIEISRHYGVDSRFVIAGGGNTSYKNAEKLWVKASGSSLATITEDGFAVLDRAKLKVLSERTYSSDSAEREEQVKNDLAAACISKGRRPSVETSMHNAIDYAFVIHLHPTAVNGLMCSNNAEADLRSLFGEKALYIPYTDPGYVLFKLVEESIVAYRKAHGAEPQVIWLQNHGIFVAANTTDEVKAIYTDVLAKLEGAVKEPLPVGEVELAPAVLKTIPGLRMLLSTQSLKALKVRANALTAYFSENEANQKKIARP